MRVLVSLAAVVVLFLMGYTAAALGLQSFVGIVVPYAAISVFLIGLVCRVVSWAKTPVPFRITTTCGQQKSLPWLKRARFDNPSTPLETIGRMLLEILFFRSLFRNTKMQLFEGRRLVYGTAPFLWAGAMLFHWSLLVVMLRHVRFFTEPAPFWVALLQRLGLATAGLV